MKKYLVDFPERLNDKYEFRAAEIIYCIENEYAIRVCDIVNNRFGLSNMDVIEAENMISKVAGYMAKYFSWDPQVLREEKERCLKMLDSYGLQVIKNWRNS